MPNTFDAKASVGAIESMAKSEIDGLVMEGNPLSDYLSTFSLDQLKAIDAQLKFDGYLPDSLPSCRINFDSEGHANSLTAKPSVFDFNAKAAYMAVGFERK